MRKLFAWAILIVLAGGTAVSAAPRAEAAVSGWQKAITVDPRWTTDFESDTFKQSLRNAAATNINHVTLTIPLYQSNIYSTDINPGWNTPTDGSLAEGIRFARSLGLGVSLKVHMVSYDGQWRAHINPEDRAGWFRAYEDKVVHYAGIGQANGAEMMAVGSELIDMATVHSNPTNTQNWNDLIARVRGVFSGKLTYSANWGGSWWADEKNRIEFWPALDYIGIAAYFALNSDLNQDALRGQWDYWRTTDIEPLKNRWGKSVIFTEIGYRSMSGARYQPFNSWDHWGTSEYEQAQLYEALFSYWNNYPWLQGVHLWDWMSDPNAGGPGNDGYTPQGKAAEQTMRTWFGSVPPPPPPPPPGPVSMSATGSADPSSPAMNQQTALTARVTNGANAASGIIVDIEVADNNDQKIFQRFFEQQSFAANESRTFDASWTPGAAGVYRLKIGVFNSTWTTQYLWVNDAATITVGSGSTSPPPPPPPTMAAVDVWWPANDAVLSGTQPFKAVLRDWNVGDYNMYWQVDGDRLNQMYTSFEDWPHKEAMVDLAGWNWKGNDSYQVNFVAKNLAGDVIAQKAVDIFVK